MEKLDTDKPLQKSNPLNVELNALEVESNSPVSSDDKASTNDEDLKDCSKEQVNSKDQLEPIEDSQKTPSNVPEANFSPTIKEDVREDNIDTNSGDSPTETKDDPNVKEKKAKDILKKKKASANPNALFNRKKKALFTRVCNIIT